MLKLMILLTPLLCLLTVYNAARDGGNYISIFVEVARRGCYSQLSAKKKYTLWFENTSSCDPSCAKISLLSSLHSHQGKLTGQLQRYPVSAVFIGWEMQ